jgi:lysophospholipase L1-like esterase
VLVGALLGGALALTGAPTSVGPSTPGAVPGAAAAPRPAGTGPVTVVALGDSLTAAEGDDAGQGFVGRLTDAIGARPGREGSQLVNLGQSGWDSTMMDDGQDGAPGQLGQALEQVRSAAVTGPVLATVLIGSNDMTLLYNASPGDGTSEADEDAMVQTYRRNLDRAVGELTAAGARVVVGLPDDQSLRPGFADVSRLNQIVSDVTAGEVSRMSPLSRRLAATAREVAGAHRALAVATDDPFWADASTMAADGLHPNADGYARLAALWQQVVEPTL